MPFAVKPYVSEATRFLQDLKANRPELESSQKQGRALLWDRQQDPELRAALDRARVAQKPYVYGID